MDLETPEKTFNNRGGIKGFFKRLWNSIIVYVVGTKWQMKEMILRPRMFDISLGQYRKGDVAVLTGGTRGIGYETLKALLISEMHVIMGSRKVTDGENAVNRIRSDGILSGTVEVLPLDLMSLQSARQFSNLILHKDIPIHLLICNAGIMFPPYKVSEDGFESQFQSNYLGHFLITNLLLPKLAQAGTPSRMSRVVNVSSIAHYWEARIDFDDLQFKKLYCPSQGYMNSKLMQVISTMDFDTKMKNANINVRFISLHPGVIYTDLYQHMFINKFSPIVRLLFLTPKQGAQTIIYAALSPDIEGEGGIFLTNSRKHPPNPIVYDLNTQSQLSKISYELSTVRVPNLAGFGKSGEFSEDPSLVSEIDPTTLHTTNPFIVNMNCMSE